MQVPHGQCYDKLLINRKKSPGSWCWRFLSEHGLQGSNVLLVLVFVVASTGGLMLSEIHVIVFPSTKDTNDISRKKIVLMKWRSTIHPNIVKPPVLDCTYVTAFPINSIISLFILEKDSYIYRLPLSWCRQKRSKEDISGCKPMAAIFRKHADKGFVCYFWFDLFSSHHYS